MTNIHDNIRVLLELNDQWYRGNHIQATPTLWLNTNGEGWARANHWGGRDDGQVGERILADDGEEEDDDAVGVEEEKEDGGERDDGELELNLKLKRTNFLLSCSLLLAFIQANLALLSPM